MKDINNLILLEKPARKWDDGLPVGNGRLGAMVMGKVNEETIFINEETIWYGREKNKGNRDAHYNIGKIRGLLLDGEVEKAAFIAKMAMTSTPKYNNPYQPAGDLRLCFMGHKGKALNYKRYLDINNAIACVEYDMNDVHYKREIIASSKYQVIAIRLSVDKGSKFTVSANMSRKPFEDSTDKVDGRTVSNFGQNGVGGVHYFTGVRMTSQDSEVKTMGDFCYTENSGEVVIYVSSLTDFNNSGDLRNICLERLDNVEKAGFDLIKSEHIKTFHSLFNRLSFSLNNSSVPNIPTNKLIEELKSGNAAHLDYMTVLLFNYARYLMISSSYRCELPANLQGIWNGSYEPPWQSEFTININLEMNYWFVDKCNLPECNMPLFRFIERLAENGTRTAKEIYGCRGFCAHHNTNLWANTDIEGIFDASPFWVMGGAWLALHMFEHYLFTGDIKFLKERALPIMESAVAFFEDYLYENEDGLLLTGPTVSPENTYISEKGQKGALSMSPTMDNMILRQLFTDYIAGMKTAYPEKSLDKVESMLNKLPKTRISESGRIMEWLGDYTETEPGHRHISHLYGLHPGNEITRENPELFEAAKRTLEYRLSNGGGHTGWSKAWICCFYARLGDGENFSKNLRELLKASIQDNMLDVHPPFQIDGNFGIANAMLEAIVQSHAGYIDILPALPDMWKDGFLKGVRLRGGLSADICWRDNKLNVFYVTADSDTEITFRYGVLNRTEKLEGGKKVQISFY